MRDDIPIPPEVVEALREELRMSRLCADPATARAAIRAALAAWPGMHHYIPNAEPYYGKHIILPLTQENSNG